MSKIKVVVELHGGVVQGVSTDSDTELEVVFLEASKYVDSDRFPVKKGPYKGLIVYSHFDSEKISAKALVPVLQAAQKRIEES